MNHEQRVGAADEIAEVVFHEMGCHKGFDPDVLDRGIRQDFLRSMSRAVEKKLLELQQRGYYE